VKSQTFAEPAPSPAPEPPADPIPMPPPTSFVEATAPEAPASQPIVETETRSEPVVEEPAPWPSYAGYASGAGFSWQTATAPSSTDEEASTESETVEEVADEAPVAETAEPVADDAAEASASDLTQQIAWSAPEPETEVEPEDPIHEQDVIAEEKPASAIEPVYASVPVESSGPPIALGESGTATLADAAALANRLSELLTQLASAPVETPAAPEDDIREQLTAALSETAVDGDAVDRLTEVVTTAKERPRDIDVLLDLTRHLDTILALKSSHDDLRSRVRSLAGDDAEA
jgi:hypothetical protein